MLRTKQKVIGWMMDSMEKFSGPGYVVVEFGAGTTAVAAACLHFSDHQSLVGCKRDNILVKEALSGSVEISAQQVTGFESDLSANEELGDAARVFLAEMDVIMPEGRQIFGRHRLDCCLCNHFFRKYYIFFHCAITICFCFKSVSILHCTVGPLCDETAFRRQIE